MTLAVALHSRLARTVAFTGRLAERRVRPRPIAALLRGVDFVARGTFHVLRNRRYYTPLKLANMALIHLQFKLKTERVLGRPYKMKIESTNICNTKCQLCPTGVGIEGRPKGKMSLGQFKRLIDEARRWLVTVDLSMWGDPLIVPEIYEMIRHAHDRGIWTYVSSNLHAFKPGRGQAEAIVRSGLDLLTCSLHGATQESYEAYQPGKRLDESVEKIRHLIEVRDAMGSATPAIQLNFVVTRYNEHEIPAFRRLADELGCKAVFSNASMNIRFLGQNQQLQSLGLAPDVLAKKTRAHLEQWLPRNQEFVLKPYAQILDGQYRGDVYNGQKMFDCSWPWKQSVINWDGQVVTCCGSFDPAEDMGNVFEKPFARIWNSRRYRMARRSFKNRVESKDATNNPCASCPGFML